MKKTILSLFALCTFIGNATADETVQILPQQIVAGSEAGDYENYFSIEMVNDDNVYTALQFDLYLPEGVEIDEYGIELNPDRFPNKVVKKQIVFEHEVTYAKRAEGFYRVSIYGTNSNPSINGTSGPICDVYYTSVDNLPTDIMPIRIEGIVLAISGTQGIKPLPNTSFLYTENATFDTLTGIDLTSEGCVTTKDVATETRSLMTNPNSLLYLNEGSNAEGLQNVVVGETCENLVLTDGYEFYAPKPFTATTASYSRTLAKDGWYSLCLPFAANAPANVTVERFTSLDMANNSVYFDSGSLEADKPCIFNAKAGSVEFIATAAAVAITPEILADGCFIGTYRQMPMGTITGYYALFADGSGFGVATDKAYATPFRGVLDAVSTAQSLKAVHGGITTEINTVKINGSSSTDSRIYNLNGQHISIPQQRGIYIINNKKVIK